MRLIFSYKQQAALSPQGLRSGRKARTSRYLAAFGLYLMSTGAAVKAIPPEFPATASIPADSTPAAQKAETLDRRIKSPVPVTAKAAIPVRATAMGLVPGAIICSDLQTAQLVGHLYAEYVKDAMADAISHGQMKLYRPSAEKPDPGLFGCAMVDPGTPMTFYSGQFAPVVTTTLSNGIQIQGVTQWGMFDGPGLHR